MNREVNDLVLVFSSAIVGAVIAFLAVLVTFTFYHEIRELLLLRGLLIPNNEPRPTNPAADWARQELVRIQQEAPQQLHTFVLAATNRNVPGLPIIRLPPNHQGNANRHLRGDPFPLAFATERNEDPWTQPPDRRP